MEIERIFKTSKQEFNFEKVGTKSFQKTENLVYLVQLCLGISAYIYNKLHPKFEFIQDKTKNITLKKLSKKITPFLKKKGVTLNKNSIKSFISYYMKFYFGSNTVKHGFNGQLSLYYVIVLKKTMPF